MVNVLKTHRKSTSKSYKTSFFQPKYPKTALRHPFFRASSAASSLLAFRKSSTPSEVKTSENSSIPGPVMAAGCPPDIRPSGYLGISLILWIFNLRIYESNIETWILIVIGVYYIYILVYMYILVYIYWYIYIYIKWDINETLISLIYPPVSSWPWLGNLRDSKVPLTGHF